MRFFYHLCLTFYFSFICYPLVYSLSFPYVYPRVKLQAKTRSQGDPGDPLILTPFIDEGNIELAQNLSRVPFTEKIGFISHSGFITVDKEYNSNLYFWYFPAFNKNKNAPVVLWLQGGPGGSSLFGLFTENGPIIVTKEGFSTRKYHWALKNHLIFIDNPVGTGFSFTDEDGYCSDEQCIAKGLYSCLQQFFKLFPSLSNNEFYITGESYAGKYIPSLAMEIHNRNLKSETKINLKGLALGNAYCDPINQMDYGNYLYQHGLIDNGQRNFFNKMQAEIVKNIQKENWMEAGILMDTLMDGDLTNFSYFKNYTGFNNYYNFLVPANMSDMAKYINLLNKDEIRRMAHVGGLPFHSGEKVQMHLAIDILKSVAPLVSELLSHYRVLFYNGQLDIIVAYPLTENFLRKLNFSSSDEYRKAPRTIWKVDNEIAGYMKRAGNITEVLVRNAGHMVPYDQPKWALDLITRFIRNKF
ncbi:venom serine carboxypeptidase-like [Vanessa atalanta]|uniref:venom serine carboxypeptidase-like n=1 Tax=Vanessa atalanta TaxID=42275 RepID=UPI001FCD6C92|nr:venom serine carboxypeptidase-like [Vanessa atalanta]